MAKEMVEVIKLNTLKMNRFNQIVKVNLFILQW